MRILFVSKDLSAQIALRTAKVAREQGDEVFVAAEGLSIALWQRAGFSLVFAGSKDFQTEPFQFDARHVLQTVQPDVLVVCSGMPINIERQIAFEGNARGIPVVLLSDIWKCAVRLGRNDQFPTLAAVLVVDEYDLSLVSGFYPTATFTVVGNAGVGEETQQEAQLQKQIADARKRWGRVVSFVGGRSSDDLALCVQSMLKTEGAIIPRLHPKSVDHRLVDGQTLRERCVELLRPLGDRVLWLDEYPMPWHSRLIVEASDIVCSGFSTLLSTAVVAGAVGVVLWTPEVRASLYTATTLEQSPHAALGVADLLTEPADLGRFRAKTALARLRLKPFDPQGALQAIRAVL